MVEVHLSGLYPRSEALIAATRAADRGKVSKADVERAFHQDCQNLVQLQTQMGIDHVVDGQLNWQDLFRPFTDIFTGIQPGSLTRWFDNNTFYRKPIIVDKVRYEGNNLQQFFRHDLLHGTVTKRAILPGPITFAAVSENKTYRDTGDLVNDFAQALKETASALSKAGYAFFQFNEPAMTSVREAEKLIRYAGRAYETCGRLNGSKTSVHTYFGDSSPILDTLLELSVDCLGVDFYATSLPSVVDRSFDKELECGCIDGRNSLLESPPDVGNFVRNVRDNVEPKIITVCPNCDLDFLPQSVAERKVRLLAEIKKELN